ncbi:MAG: hypothetical protein DCC54_11655 [Anaerolineae bacterium]|nr:MAG: hypothetical protein DCC54_11655 [Anaerolineae bacterium]
MRNLVFLSGLRALSGEIALFQWALPCNPRNPCTKGTRHAIYQPTEDAGARVDYGEKIARIPPALAEHALDIAPKAFTLGARTPQHDYPLPSPVTRYCIDGTGAFVQDFHTGERRYGANRDNEQALRVFQSPRRTNPRTRARSTNGEPRSASAPSTDSTRFTPPSRRPSSPKCSSPRSAAKTR